MKIGILTYHSVYNFGANLQVHSTIGYLKNNGFEPIVINWIPQDLEDRYTRTIPLVQANAHKKFIKDFLPCTDLCRTESDIVQVIEAQKIRGVIIGSDAVLQHNTIFSRIHVSRKGIIISPKPGTDVLFPNPFWGSFIPGLKVKIPVVIMSASSQHSNFKYIRGSLKKKINNSLSQFKLITARDNWTRRMVEFLTDGTIVPSVTPDPVFAYNQNIKVQCSKEEIINKFNLPDKYILLSFRDTKVVSKAWLLKFEFIAKKNNLACVALTMPAGIKFEPPYSLAVDSPLGPKEWYGLIKYSSGYIGENMHPIIVALHNVVPFYSFDPYGIVKYKFFVKEESSKIYDLLAASEFLQNRTSRLGKGYKCPSPEEVFCRINDFDFSKCHLFITNQLNSYNLMMEKITSLF
jgi:hypothetical protein